MKSKLKRVLIVGMAGMMVLGGGISAFADDLELETADRPVKFAVGHRLEGERIKDKICDLSEDIQEQLKDLRDLMGENRDLANEIIGIEMGQKLNHANAANKAAGVSGKFEGKLDKLRENHPDKAERLDEKFEDFKNEVKLVRNELLEERQALREERQERINELKEEYPDEFQELEGNREEIKLLRDALRQAIVSGDEGEIENLIEEIRYIVEENREILEAVSELEE